MGTVTNCCELCVYGTGSHLLDCPVRAHEQFLKRLKLELDDMYTITDPELIRRIVRGAMR